MWILEVIKYVIGLIILVILAILIIFFGIYKPFKNIRNNTLGTEEHEEWKRELEMQEKERDRKNPKILEIKENIKKLLDEEIKKIEENKSDSGKLRAMKDLRETECLFYDNYWMFVILHFENSTDKSGNISQKKEGESPFITYWREWKEERENKN